MMKFVIMHATDARWEAGEVPGRELIGRVGALIGELSKSGAFKGGDGLRASSEGVRITVSHDEWTTTPGPFTPGNELTSAFSIVRTASLDEAVDFAAKQAAILGDGEFDIRPVTEPWEIGLAPAPPGVATRRYMVQRKATAATESGVEPTAAQRSSLAKMVDASTRAGIHIATHTMRPSGRGRRYVNARNGVSMFDGPFVETKELLAGFMIVEAASLDEAGRWAERYIDAVESPMVDVRELA
jgi:hypothetical protein